MAPTQQETTSHLAGIRGLPYGTARTAAAEAITRRIEAEGPRECLPEALLDLVEAYSFTDLGLQSFVTFARLLRLWDANPELFDEADVRNLFWEYKWVAGDLADFPLISVAQAEAMLADMRRRFALAGKGLSSVAMSDFRWAWQSGSPEAEATRLAWITGGRDENDDCLACRIGQQVDFFTDTGRYREAIELGATLESSCNIEPARARHALALAQLLSGDSVAAVRAYQQARASLDDSTSDFASSRGQGFELLARGGQLRRALRELRDEYPQLLVEASSPLARLRFLLGILSGLSANLDQGELATGLREAPATVAELREWVKTEAVGLADSFDQRRGNDHYAAMVTRALAAARVPQPLEFAAPATQSTPKAVVEREIMPPASVPQLAAEAEALVAAGDQRSAAAAYLSAAYAAEADGLLAEAGLFWAEAAHATSETDDLETAHEHYAAALARLVAAGAELDLVAQVLQAWAPIAVAADDTAALIELVSNQLAALASLDVSDLSAELAQTRQHETDRVKFELQDCLARLIASTRPEDLQNHSLADAVRLATEAGEGLGGLGRVAAAAHAFWLAGQLLRDLGDLEGAIWSLESAMEGFAAVHATGPRADAAGHLIELLRQTGQPERAEVVVASLS